MSINYFRNAADTEAYIAGQTIFSEGVPSNVMYAVIEGEVDTVFGDRILETVVPGGIFGEMTLVSDLPRSANAIAGSRPWTRSTSPIWHSRHPICASGDALDGRLPAA